MSINREIDMYSLNDVLDALKKIEERGGTAEDLASELTGLSIDSLWELREASSPVYFVSEIEWDTDEDSAEALGLPGSCFISTSDEDEIADILSDTWEYFVCSFCDILSDQDTKRVHAINVLFKKGYSRDEAEALLRKTNILEKKAMADSDILDLIKKERRPV